MTTAAYQPIVTQAGLNAAAQAQADSRVLSITHVALGTGSYAPTGLETALQAEVSRTPIRRRKYLEGSVWQVAATVTGESDYFAREVGFFADDNGTPVLLFIFSSVDRVFAAVTEGQETLMELNVSLASIPGGVVEFSFLDTDVAEQEMLDDFSGLHEEDGQFNFALTRNIEQHEFMAMENFEMMAQIRRGYGQSGIRTGRHYAFGGDAPYHRPSVVNFAAFGVHDHPNYPLMCGMPEITAVVNGHEVNTRHIDYRVMHSVGGGAYLEVESAIPPAVPASVLAQATPEAQTAEMREYMRAFARKDTGLRDYRTHFDTYLSVLEVWLETFDGDSLVDTFSSFRHQLSNLGHKVMNDDYMAMLASGLKPRFENMDFKPTVIRVMRPDGRPEFAVLRYRVSAMRLGTYGQYPAHRMTSLVDDPATRIRKNVDDAFIAQRRLGRFRVNHALDDSTLAERSSPGLLDEIMQKVPGLDGMGSVVHELYEDTQENSDVFQQQLRDFQQTTRLNSAYYHRFYSLEQAGAAGRRDYRLGYNDPYLFKAATTKTQVVDVSGTGGGHRLSWAIPLELIVASPLGAWNPYDIPIGGVITGNGHHDDTAFSKALKNGRWFMTPADLFDGDGAALDAADTGKRAWMTCGDGVARLMRGSGVYVHTPGISGVESARMRYPIAPVHHEGSFEFGHIEALRKENQSAMATMADAILEMKHTARYGGTNGT